ncbi:MAG TPA: isoleucine--tRNA ligase [Ruminococcaceae bacterium]|nr:isoleucine--tRNA ligase [Oscillospiraceae bacterium]
MYEPISPNVNFVEQEKKIEKFWHDNKIFEKSIALRKEGTPYVFYDGPPTANGKPHIGHVLTRVIKDMIPRYRTMKGCMVPRKAGWDTHGLPVELEVEKMLGLDGKEQIEEYGLEPFISHCKESVWKYKGMWEDFSRTVGFWADMDNPYVTYHNSYIESEWWALKKIYEKGLLYKGFKIVPYCPRCGTPLSSHEVAQGYKTVKERSAVVRFKVKNEDAYFLAWTTTPWTLPSNVALCVNPDDTYCKVKAADGFTYYMAKALLDKVLSKLGNEDTPAYEILEEFPGKALEYKEYEPLFSYVKPLCDKQGKKAFFVMCDSYVTMTDGTGIVHCAPAFGEDDARVGRKYDLPFIQLVDGKGDMTEPTPYVGTFVKDADKLVLVDLEKAGLLFDAPKFEHEYPHCWRCKDPVIFRATQQWFCSVDGFKEQAIEAVKSVKWIPDWGEDRITGMIRDRSDWCISRQRTWGVPIPIFYCKDCGKYVVNDDSIHAVSELFREKGSDAWYTESAEQILPKDFTCPHCGGKHFTKETDIMDVWFDSGCTHAAVLDQRPDLKWPCDLYLEGNDQYRGWFQSSLLTSVAWRGQAPYKAVCTHGWVVDGEGRKMSKSLGNGIAPEDIINEYGADILRLWVASSDYHADIKISKDILKQLSEQYRKIRNTARFILGTISDFDPNTDAVSYDQLEEMDKWALMRLDDITKEVNEAYEAFDYHIVFHTIHNFCVLDMSNFYLDVLKDRLYVEKTDSLTRRAAQTTVYHILVSLTKLIAPILSFTAEEIWGYIPKTKDMDARSVILNEIDKASSRSFDDAFRAKWDRIHALRDTVNKALEAARADKSIGKSLEACVTLTCDGELYDFVSSVSDCLAQAFIVSQVKLVRGQAQNAEAGEPQITISRAEGEKCERCWMYSHTVGSVPEHPTLCKRCADILK